jgi:hypothetical protein
MDWLIWLLLAFGAFALLVRRGSGCGMGHGGHRHDKQADSRQEAPRRETTAATAGADQRTPASVDHTHG